VRFGICTQADQISLISTIGYDYAELPLAQTAALSDENFATLVRQVRQTGLPVEVFNIFFPRQMRLTGSDANLEAAWSYARSAFKRAATLGAHVVVFGSGAARNVPEGFSMMTARAQLVELLRGLDAIAGEHGITVAIEPLNRSESNIITSVADALSLALEVARPNIQVLADSYHMLRENEDPAILPQVGSRLVHVHTARGEARLYPTEADDQLRAFFTALRMGSYNGRVSIEGRTENIQADAAASLAVLRSLAG